MWYFQLSFSSIITPKYFILSLCSNVMVFPSLSGFIIMKLVFERFSESLLVSHQLLTLISSWFTVSSTPNPSPWLKERWERLILWIVLKYTTQVYYLNQREIMVVLNVCYDTTDKFYIKELFNCRPAPDNLGKLLTTILSYCILLHKTEIIDEKHIQISLLKIWIQAKCYSCPWLIKHNKTSTDLPKNNN